MPIGTSLGAHFEDDFDHQAGREYTPPEIKPKDELIDSNVKTPNEAQQDKQLNDIEMQELGGIPIRMRIFPQKEDQPIEIADRQSDAANKSFKGGYLGDKALSEKDNDQDNFWFKDDWQNTWDSAVGKSIWKDDAKGFIEKQGPDVEGFTTPGSEMLWLRRRSPPQDSQSVPMSSNDDVRPTPDYMNPPYREPVQVAERPPAQVLFKTKTGVTITDHDIEDGMHVAMSSGTGTIGSLKGKWFAKGPAAEVIPPAEAARLQRQPSNITEPTPHQPVTRRAGEDDTDYALRVIADVLDNPGHAGSYTRPLAGRPVGWDDEAAAVARDFEAAGEQNPYRRPHPDDDGLGHADWMRQEPYIHDDEVIQPARTRTDRRSTLYDEDGQPIHRDDIDSFIAERAEHNKRVVEQIKKEFQDKADKVKSKGTIAMLRGPSSNANTANFQFISKDGVPGEMTVIQRSSGKDLHVSWIGGVGGNGANDIGKSEMKNLFKLLADEFPKAEYVTGFRVSGARGARGRPDDAMMYIPGRKKTSE